MQNGQISAASQAPTCSQNCFCARPPTTMPMCRAGTSDCVCSRYHRSLNNRILLENYYLPGQLEQRLAEFVVYYNLRRYHESLNNLTPADVYFGRAQTILTRREKHQAENYRATTPAALCNRSHNCNLDGPDPLLNLLLTYPKGSDDIELGHLERDPECLRLGVRESERRPRSLLGPLVGQMCLA